jgi:SET domain-containing protein
LEERLIDFAAMPKTKPQKKKLVQTEIPEGLNKGKFIQPKPHPVLCEVRTSDIHGSGVFATEFLPNETQIIEYLGEKITKAESDRRGWKQLEDSKKTGDGGVYLFTLNKKYDVDGHFDWNIARLINHSCDPNCEAYITRGRIWIWCIRDIADGEELSFNYGFDLENYEDHPCRCGSTNCVGYIAGEDYWADLELKLAGKA